jgi:hypothetical protein
MTKLLDVAYKKGVFIMTNTNVITLNAMVDYLKSTLTEPTQQEFTSADTSVNRNRLPKVFSAIKSWKADSINLDLGGGKFDNATEYLYSQYGCTNLIFDRFNRSVDWNTQILNYVTQVGGADTLTCANVLNVIAESEIRLEVIAQAYALLKSDGIAYFQIYEGNGSGVGSQTKIDCWQNNLKANEYISELETYFNIEKVSNKIIVCTKK